jgi:hypothetical protein
MSLLIPARSVSAAAAGGGGRADGHENIPDQGAICNYAGAI